MGTKRIAFLACLSCLAMVGCSDDSANKGEESAPVCGNGVRENGESCDDGNVVPGDGCSSACTVEAGWTCSTDGCSRDPEPVITVCGNGILEDGEDCDDGNVAPDDGCSATCTVEAGWTCTTDGCSRDPEPVEAVCGDGVVEGDEKCDDGNVEAGDGCDERCRVEPGYACDPDCHTVCGDGVMTDDEECDDGGIDEGGPFGGDGCSETCKVESGWTCIHENRFSYCVILRCGDGIVSPELGEECDVPGSDADYGYDDERGQAACTRDCTFTEYCGDGTVQTAFGEECDLGMTDESGLPIGGDGSYGGCMPNCQLASYCGDGIRDAEEACDDGEGAGIDGDGCSADCKTIETGWQCDAVTGACFRMTCGNGVHDDGEACDDGNFVDGDGCFNCRAEAGYMCRYSPTPCPDEICGEVRECALISELYGDGVITAGYEECDDGNRTDGDGCTQGAVDPGYSCPIPGQRCIATACGDGIVAYGEQCDDGNTADGDGCSARCRLETGFACPEPGKPCAIGYCGDGIVQHGETCDNDIVEEGTAPIGGDGCSSTCQIETGYRCLAAGGKCESVDCGDGKINDDPLFVSDEECDLGEDLNGDGASGCSENCHIEPGYHCTFVDGEQECTPGTCGDGFLDVGEECDDGNKKGGDGCNPNCKRESVFECDDGSCKPVCGDGVTMWMLPEGLAEECDDGNLISGDGCSSQCKLEKGFECTDFKSAKLPATIDVPVTYYDFIYGTISGTGDGYMTQEFTNEINADPLCANANHKMVAGKGFPDFQIYGGSGCRNMLENELDVEGKPVMSKRFTAASWPTDKCYNNDGVAISTLVKSHITCPKTFSYWYRYTPGINKAISSTLRLTLVNEGKGIYEFDYANPRSATDVNGKPLSSGQFCPINNAGYSVGSTANVGGFTSELNTYFQYKGGETLTFRGDDDVWVFVNNKLFVDLGGMQSLQSRSGTLQSIPYVVGQDEEGHDITMNHDPNLDVYEGGIYEIKLFHAERMFGSSNFTLQLAGFLNTGKAVCASVCGDGVIVAGEECDNKDHVDDEQAVFLGCVNCKRQPVCGNGILEAGEACDPGHLCKDVSSELCETLGISYIPDEACNLETCRYDSCGDGVLNPWEECDCHLHECTGEDPDCTPDLMCEFAKDVPSDICLTDTCKVARCGDGIVTPEFHELCDNGAGNDDNGDCTTLCQPPSCGDGIVSTLLGEACDLGRDEDGNSLNTGAYGTDGKPGCSMDCRFKTPYCGDGKLQTAHGEECDDGEANDDNAYNGCTTQCKLGPRCGDGIVQPGEGCDLGDKNGDSGACSKSCTVRVN